MSETTTQPQFVRLTVQVEGVSFWSFIRQLQAPARPRTLNKTQFKRIRRRSFRLVSRSKKELNPTCVICTDEFENSDTVKALKCGHVYHCSCLEKWLCERADTCPICRQTVSEDRDETSTRGGASFD